MNAMCPRHLPQHFNGCTCAVTDSGSATGAENTAVLTDIADARAAETLEMLRDGGIDMEDFGPEYDPMDVVFIADEVSNAYQTAGRGSYDLSITQDGEGVATGVVATMWTDSGVRLSSSTQDWWKLSRDNDAVGEEGAVALAEGIRDMYDSLEKQAREHGLHRGPQPDLPQLKAVDGDLRCPKCSSGDIYRTSSEISTDRVWLVDDGWVDAKNDDILITEERWSCGGCQTYLDISDLQDKGII